MSRKNYYKKIQSQKSEKVLVTKCNELMRDITKLGHVNTKDLLIIISFRTGIPLEKLNIKELDDSKLEKIIEELTYIINNF